MPSSDKHLHSTIYQSHIEERQTFERVAFWLLFTYIICDNALIVKHISRRAKK